MVPALECCTMAVVEVPATDNVFVSTATVDVVPVGVEPPHTWPKPEIHDAKVVLYVFSQETQAETSAEGVSMKVGQKQVGSSGLQLTLSQVHVPWAPLKQGLSI